LQRPPAPAPPPPRTVCRLLDVWRFYMCYSLKQSSSRQVPKHPRPHPPAPY
jgi:hypothetical protein